MKNYRSKSKKKYQKPAIKDSKLSPILFYAKHNFVSDKTETSSNLQGGALIAYTWV